VDVVVVDVVVVDVVVVDVVVVDVVVVDVVVVDVAYSVFSKEQKRRRFEPYTQPAANEQPPLRVNMYQDTVKATSQLKREERL
jgi:hypothetical protein